MFNSAQPSQPFRRHREMSLAAWYLHKVDQCLRLTDDAAEALDVARFTSERSEWLRLLAEEIGADVAVLEAAIASLPIEDGNED
jgi:hypothetical protein